MKYDHHIRWYFHPLLLDLVRGYSLKINGQGSALGCNDFKYTVLLGLQYCKTPLYWRFFRFFGRFVRVWHERLQKVIRWINKKIFFHVFQFFLGELFRIFCFEYFSSYLLTWKPNADEKAQINEKLCLRIKFFSHFRSGRLLKRLNRCSLIDILHMIQTIFYIIHIGTSFNDIIMHFFLA